MEKSIFFTKDNGNMRSRYLTKFHGQKNYDNIEDTEEN